MKKYIKENIVYKVIHGPVPSNYNAERFGQPLVILEDEYGGQSVITKDDSCFVLFNGSNNHEFRMVSHWYPEAATALRNYLNELEMENLII